MTIHGRYSAWPSAPAMVGMAGATMVWSSAASSIDNSTPPMMTFFSLSVSGGGAKPGMMLFV